MKVVIGSDKKAVFLKRKSFPIPNIIVNESQEAILFKGGKALDVFQSGRHTLDTANIPILNKIIIQNISVYIKSSR